MNNPYKVIFESLPFDEAVEFSVRYAKNKVGKATQNTLDFQKQLEMYREGVICFNSGPVMDIYEIVES